MSKVFPKKVVLASLIGGAVEFYDFTLYGALAFAFAPQFFPQHDPFYSLLSAYAVFAVGFFARPLGSFLFGYLGDRFGRRTALFISLFLMALATLSMGVLPTYERIGVMAPILMVAARLLQGLSAGGEYSGALIFSIEHGSQHQSGFIGSSVAAGCMSGLVLGSLASLICSLPGIPEWGWRVPFLIGFAISLVGLYVRFSLQETPAFQIVKNNQPVMSFQKIFAKNYRSFLAVVALSGFNGIAIYVYFVFLSTYFIQQTGAAEIALKLYSCVTTFLLMGWLVLFGALSDRLARPRLIQFGAWLTIVVAVLMFMTVSHVSLLGIVVYQLLFVMALGMYSGPLNTFIIETFSVGVRYRLASVSYSIGMGLIGGSAPLLAGWLSRKADSTVYLSYYFIIGGIAALVALRVLSRERLVVNAKRVYSAKPI